MTLQAFEFVIPIETFITYQGINIKYDKVVCECLSYAEKYKTGLWDVIPSPSCC